MVAFSRIRLCSGFLISTRGFFSPSDSCVRTRKTPPSTIRRVVFLRMDSVSGELETSLSFNSAVAPRRVATTTGEDADDIPWEAEGPLDVRALNLQRGLRAERAPTLAVNTVSPSASADMRPFASMRGRPLDSKETSGLDPSNRVRDRRRTFRGSEIVGRLFCHAACLRSA